jgi:hypothetical protein
METPYSTAKKILFYPALAGWLMSLIVHLLSIFDVYFGDNLHFDVCLSIGIFFIWGPAIFISRAEKELKQPDDLHDQGNIFSDIEKIPRWLLVIAVVSFIYASVNFWVCLNGYSAEIYNGQYVLMEKSTFIKYLTRHEYVHYKANEARLSTGHCMAFYAVGAVMLLDR